MSVRERGLSLSMLKSKYGNEKREICVAVATHKYYQMPNDSIYLPLHVGAAFHPDDLLFWMQDNTGDNISSLNPFYSELTGLYWMWKNCDAYYKGLVHYRRHFRTSNIIRRITAKNRFDQICTSDEIKETLKKKDIILPKQRKYYIETIYSHYIHTLPAEQLEETKKIIESMGAKFSIAFEHVMNSSSAHMFNMMIMRSDYFDEYCAWLFPILDELTNRIRPEKYNAFNARYPGRISELLLDVWLDVYGYDYAELPTISPEPVDWWKKGTSFLMAKYAGKKYEKSF